VISKKNKGTENMVV